MTNKPPVTETFADVLPRLMRDLQAGVHLGERSAINRLERRAELRAAGIPEHDLPPIIDETGRIVS